MLKPWKLMSYSYASAFGLQAKRIDQLGQPPNMLRSAKAQSLNLLFASYEWFGTLPLYARLNLLLGIDLGRVDWQVQQLQHAVETKYIVAHDFGLINVVSVHSRPHWRLRDDQESLEEFTKNLGCDAAILRIETKGAASSDSRNQVQLKFSPGHCPNGVWSSDTQVAPMRVPANAQLDVREDRGPSGLRHSASSGIGFAPPLLRHHECLLPTLIQRPLHFEAKQAHDATDRGRRQFRTKLATCQVGQQLERPQVKLEVEMQECVSAQRLRQQKYVIRPELERTVGNGLGQHHIWPSLAKSARRPCKLLMLITMTRPQLQSVHCAPP